MFKSLISLSIYNKILNLNLLMEKQSGIAYYDLDTLCSEAVHRNFRGEGNTVGSVISAASYALTWNTFTR